MELNFKTSLLRDLHPRDRRACLPVSSPHSDYMSIKEYPILSKKQLNTGRLSHPQPRFFHLKHCRTSLFPCGQRSFSLLFHHPTVFSICSNNFMAMKRHPSAKSICRSLLKLTSTSIFCFTSRSLSHPQYFYSEQLTMNNYSFSIIAFDMTNIQ